MIPKYYEMYKPFLEYLKDGNRHTLKELKGHISTYFRLNVTELEELLPSKRQTVFSNRVGWARTYLKNAGLISSPERAVFVITNVGLKVLEENTSVIDNEYLMQFDSFREFKGNSYNPKSEQTLIEGEKDTPDDVFEFAFQKINESLEEEILGEIMKLSPTAFEKMVIDLLYKMGYGAFENSGITTPKTGDEGIDGIIMEDKLGFNLIYIQAKQWDVNRTVGRPEIQGFVGAIIGKGGKGLFVTTAKYSKPAIEYGSQHRIVLIDGEKLAKLMVEYNFGVSVKKTFEIKAIDTDVFNEYLEQ